MPACTPLCCRFNAIFDQHLLSWLEEYPWSQLEIALAWLTLLLRYSGSLGPTWWNHISLSSYHNNPGISWLWNLPCETDFEQQLGPFLQVFLQCPERCHRLSVGKASSTGHFAQLCTKIVLNNCLGSTNLLNSRYFFFFPPLLNV